MTALFPPFPVPPFPEIGLPIFLQPLRLVPHYQRRVGETLTRWLEGRHTQIFGPLEQVVAATVIIGLAMQTPPDFWSGHSPLPVSPSGPAPSIGNRTSDAVPASTSNGPPHAAPVPLSSWLGQVQDAMEHHLPSPMTLALIGMMLNLAVMLVPPLVRHRMRQSWDLFWPPWQDRTTNGQPARAATDGIPQVASTTESERAREVKADSRRIDPQEEMTEEERRRMKDKQRPQVAAQARAAGEREGKDQARSMGKEKERVTAAGGGDSMGTKTREERAVSEEEKAILKAKQKARLEAAEKAKDAGEGLTPEEKEKIRAKQKARMQAAEGSRDAGEGLTPEDKEKIRAKQKARLIVDQDKGKGKSASEADGKGMTEEEKARLKAKLKARELEKAKAAKEGTGREDVGGKTSGRDRSLRPTEDDRNRLKMQMEKTSLAEKPLADGIERTAPVDPSASGEKGHTGGSTPPAPPPGLSRSELARWYKKQHEGGNTANMVAVTSSGTSSGPAPLDPAISSSSTSTVAPPKSALKKPLSSTQSTAPKPADPADSDTPGPKNADEPDTSGPSSGEDDALMAGDYRPLKSALKKSKKKPRQKKNIHHNYFMTMRGYQPHLVPFPHGLHPKPYHPRHTLWWDNVPKNAGHIMAPPAVPKEPEGDGGEEKKESEKEGKGTEMDKGNGGAEKSKSTTSRVEKDRVKAKEASKAKEVGDDQSKVDVKGEKVRSSEISSSGKDRSGSDRPGDGKIKDVKPAAIGSDSKEDRGRVPTSRSSSGKEKPRNPADPDKVKEKEKLKAKEKEKDGDKEKEKEKEKEKARMKAAAEAEKAKEAERAKARAKLEEAKARAPSVPAPSSSGPPMPPPPPQVDPQLRRANFIAQGMLCSLIYMANEQLALLLMAFFVYTYIQAQQQLRPSPPVGTHGPISPGPSRSAGPEVGSSSDPRTRRARFSDPSSEQRRTETRGSVDMPQEMEEKLKSAKSAREPMIHTEPGSEGDAHPHIASGAKQAEYSQRPELAGSASSVNRGTDSSAKPCTVGSEAEVPRTLAERDASRKPMTLDELTPEQRERYLQVKKARMAQTAMASGSKEPSRSL